MNFFFLFAFLLIFTKVAWGQCPSIFHISFELKDTQILDRLLSDPYIKLTKKKRKLFNTVKLSNCLIFFVCPEIWKS